MLPDDVKARDTRENIKLRAMERMCEKDQMPRTFSMDGAVSIFRPFFPSVQTKFILYTKLNDENLGHLVSKKLVFFCKFVHHCTLTCTF